MHLALVAFVALVAACGGGGEGGGRDAPRTASGRGPSNELLIVGYDREPDTMNRFATHILEDIQTCVVEGLTVTDEQMRVIPLLAETVPTLENGLVTLRRDGGMDVTWKLRPGVKWHDGVPHTAYDVQFTVAAINDPKWNPESTDGFDRITSVDVPDSLTAVVHYKEVYAPYALQFIRGTLPKHLLDGRDIDQAADYNRAPLGTGPYRVKEWKTGEHVLLDRVSNYWRGDSLPAIRQILFKFIPNAVTRVNQLLAGEVHVVALVPWDRAAAVRAVPGITLHQIMGNSYEHVTLNQRRVTAFADVRVRRALTMAVDRPLITKALLDDLAPVIHGPIQPLSWAFTENVRHYPFDVAAARALLDSAGWRDSDNDGVRDNNGTKLAFTLLTQAGFTTRETVAQALQRMWKDVGVAAEVRLVDGTAISGYWFRGDFDAMLHWWHMPADPELTLFFAKDRTPPAGRNINYVSDDSLTTLLYASDRTVDETRRKALLIAAQQRIAELAPEITLYNVTRLDAVPKTLQGFTGNPTNAGIFWNVHQWRIAP
ncbi:MAG: peptide ABC transporter substrate-binding protein [Gemmatimonadaceae bacterium]|jgi:peptide/nickel transport system substrate-binding protein|nr:peptide ABC transporter substrate-binding protein [Gemmatimonadaceae bacterium]